MKIKNSLLHFKHKKTSYLLGLDIGQNFIRLVELSYLNAKYRVESCINLELTKPIISDAMITATIKNILKQLTPKTKSVAIALPHTLAIFREMHIASDLTPEEIDKFLNFNLTESLGKITKEISFDYRSLKTVENGTQTKLHVVAVRREHTEKWIKLLHATDLCLKIIDINVYALARAVLLQLKNSKQPIAIINLEYEQILVVVIDNRKIIYLHEDRVKEENLVHIDQILELLDLKLRLIYSVLLQPLSQLILGGKIASQRELINIISNKFNIQTTAANPFLGMELSASVNKERLSTLSPLMLISCGLALRVNDDKN